MIEEIRGDTRKKMDHTLEMLKRDLTAVRTGRANPGLLNPVMVNYYGTHTPLNQIASIATPDPQLLTVQPYDKSIVKDVEKAIASSDLGFNPQVDGTLIRVPIPPLTEERRKELVKHVHKMGEDSKVALRNIRRDANDKLKKLEKDKKVSQDEERRAQEQIQQETDGHTKKIDEIIKSKEKELMTV
jgi:ribosome recycling factor